MSRGRRRRQELEQEICSNGEWYYNGKVIFVIPRIKRQ